MTLSASCICGPSCASSLFQETHSDRAGLPSIQLTPSSALAIVAFQPVHAVDADAGRIGKQADMPVGLLQDEFLEGRIAGIHRAGG